MDHCAGEVEEALQLFFIKVKPLLRCYSEFILVYICNLFIDTFVYLLTNMETINSNVDLILYSNFAENTNSHLFDGI